MSGQNPNPFEPEPPPKRRDEISLPRIRRQTSALTYLPALVVAVAATFWMMRLLAFASESASTNWLLSNLVFFGGFLVSFAIAVWIFSDIERFWPWRAGLLFTALASLLVTWFLSSTPTPLRGSLDAELPEREASIEEWRQLNLKAAFKWFGDVQASGAHGAPGVTPPWIEMREGVAGIKLTNLTDRELGCVELIRIHPSGKSCRLLVDGAACAVLAPHASHTWQDEKAGSCVDVPLAFRIGNLRHPEPSWWSDSALTAWRRNLDSVESSEEVYGVPPLDAAGRGAVVKQLEADLTDFDRADRWRYELAELARQTALAAPVR